MQGNIESAKLELKKVSFAELANAGFLAKARKGYVCPNCANGSGSDGTGAIVKQGSDGEQLLCGKCQDGFDVIDILGHFWNLDPNDKKDFVEILMRGCNRFNIHFDDDGNAVSDRNAFAHKEVSPTQVQKRLALIKSTITNAHNHLNALLDKHGGLWRGLDRTTLNDFFIGFDKAWYAREGAPLTPRVIIPTSFNHYLARLDANISDFNVPDGVLLEEKEHRGEKEIFNFKRALLDSTNPLCLVVEGEIDAMSIAQVTRQLDANNKAQYPVNVIATGGTNPAPAAWTQFKSLNPKNFIVLFDNDKAGRNAAPIFASKLQALGHQAIVADLSSVHIDANDFLLADSNALKLRINEIIASALFVNNPALLFPNDIDNKIADWQDVNGKINPDILPKIKNAAIFLTSLTPFNINATIVQDVKTLNSIALCQFYSCFVFAANHFFLILDRAKSIAKLAIKLIEAEGSDFVAISPELQTLVKISSRKLNQDISKIISQFRADHKKFLKLQRRNEIQELAEQRHKQQADAIAYEQKTLDELIALPPSTERNAAIVQAISSLCQWKFDKKGNPVAVKSTQANADLIFSYDPYINGLFGFDEFQQADVFLKPPPWRPDAKKGDEWSDRDDANIKTYLRGTYTEFASDKLVANNITVFSDRHKFHEVKNFFNDLPTWDGTKRADSFFIKFLRAEDSPYTREVTLNWLTAAIARIFHPGCDYQLAPILLGEQGIGKSYSLNKLGGKWYGSLVDDVSDPHAIDAIQKLWIVEIKEMAAMKKDVDANKRFIDAARDTRRQAYARRATTVPRHCVFIITTNNQMCLTDMTGNRRYPIIKCSGSPRQYVEGLTNNFIAQLWAEVFAHFNELFKDGFDEKLLELSRDSQILSDEIAEDYLRDDGMESEIRAHLDTKILPLILWYLLTRSERRKFFIDGKIELEKRDLEARFKNSTKKITPERQTEFDAAITESDSVLRVQIHNKFTSEYFEGLTFYGSVYRQHVCAVEIYNECFGNDRRKSPTRINEILHRLDDWELGTRIQKADPAYFDQKKVFYRKPNTQSTDTHSQNSFSYLSSTVDKDLPLDTDEDDLPF